MDTAARSNPPAMSAAAAFGWLGSRDTIRRILYMAMVAMLFVYMYLLFREVMIILLGTSSEAEPLSATREGPAGGKGFERPAGGQMSARKAGAGGGGGGLAESGFPNQLEWQTTVLQTLRYIEDKVASVEYRMAINEARRGLEQDVFDAETKAKASERVSTSSPPAGGPRSPAAPAPAAPAARPSGAPVSAAAESSPTYICCDTPAMATQHLVELLADSLASRYHLPQTRDAVRLSLITSLTEMAQRYHGVVIVD